MLTQYLEKLIEQNDLTENESERAIEFILETDNETQISAFITLLHAKGETVEEILGIVKTMRKSMLTLNTPYPVLDIVGTGGDHSNTINISTGSALLAASCGVKVIKHGNRAISSQCGSADVLEALGIKINTTPKTVGACVDQTNFGFCYAPAFHPAFKKIKTLRRELGIHTIFNSIGPLLNPAKAEYLMIGLADPKLLDTFAEVLMKLETKRALIFHSEGLDEITSAGPIKFVEVNGQKINRYTMNANDFGFEACHISDLQGGTANINANILRDAFSGKEGPIADTLLLNVGLAIYLYGLANSIEEGIVVARAQLGSGEVLTLIKNLAALTQNESSKSEVDHV